MNSYSVRCIFICPTEDINRKKYLYEERITVWKGRDIDEALDKAENEAKEYCKTFSIGEAQYTGTAQAFWIFQEVNIEGLEVFSLLRESDLGKHEYIEKFFSNGDERQRKNH